MHMFFHILLKINELLTKPHVLPQQSGHIEAIEIDFVIDCN